MGDGDGLWESLWSGARDAWPEVFVSFEDFVSHVQSCGHSAPDLSPSIANDLYLAFACARGEAAALRHFEGVLLPAVDGVAVRLGRRGVEPEEARQAVRVRLFAGEAPRIGEYRGRGSLRAWLRVVATRTLLNLTDSKKDRPHEDVEHLTLLAAGADPELEYMQRAYSALFREALARAARLLETRERAVLRLSLVQGMSIDTLGELYGVHRATAARWIQGAHRKLCAGVRETLCEQVRDDDVESVLRVVSTCLDTSLDQYLATHAHDQAEAPGKPEAG
jgi:RNA polymerase sigma-70 factor (ECF subfamily)